MPLKLLREATAAERELEALEVSPPLQQVFMVAEKGQADLPIKRPYGKPTVSKLYPCLRSRPNL